MDQLTIRLLRLLRAYHGWRRAVLVVQRADGMVGWLKLPDDLELTLRLNSDATVSLTLGHRDAGEAFLAELATLVGETEARVSKPAVPGASAPVEPSQLAGASSLSP
jgi:hypothetical protein